MGPRRGGASVCVPVTWVTSRSRRRRGREGVWAVRCCEVKPPTLACGAHGPDPRWWREKVGQGRGRPPKADRSRRAQHHLSANPHLPWPTKKGGQGGKFERGGGGRWHSSGFDYFRRANGLCWLFFRLMANRLRSNNKYLGVSDFGTRECLYLVTTGR